jgi:hypothetical protein
MPFVPILVAAAPAFAASTPVYVATACTGSDLEFVKAVPKRLADDTRAHYAIKVTVVNRGASQPGNVLQSVVMVQDGNPTDRKGIPPLKSGQAYSYKEPFSRAVDAGDGTTDLKFVFRRDAPPLDADDCLGSSLKITF